MYILEINIIFIQNKYCLFLSPTVYKYSEYELQIMIKRFRSVNE